MINAEEHLLLLNTDPGTAMGEPMRCDWHPIGIGSDLTGKMPTKAIRLLDEDLVP